MKKQKKILYFDCSSGISGDMTLGALLDLGLDREKFLRELGKLHLDGYDITFETTQRNAITATHVKVNLTGKPAHGSDTETGHVHACGAGTEHIHQHDPEPQPIYEQEAGTGHAHHHDTKPGSIHEQEAGMGHAHHHGAESEAIHEQKAGTGHVHHHEHRSFRDIRRMIQDSELDPEVKDLALRIFTRVAKAEARVHRRPVEEVQFHEVGAVDSIVDIVGSAILFCMIHPDAVYASVIQDGHGFVECQHGLLPVPVPAVSEIFAASDAIVRQIDVDTELVTPTGAAIIAELADGFGTMPAMKTVKNGWGAGTKILKIPNLLKVSLGYLWKETDPQEDRGQLTGEIEYQEPSEPESESKTEPGSKAEPGTNQAPEFDQDEVMVLQTSLDDCTGEILGDAMERLFQEGALDVFYTPIYMKKNRPAWMLTVLCRPGDSTKLEQAVFRYTTTIGIRKHREIRSILKRNPGSVQTPFGELTVKQVRVGREIRAYPEYESAVKLAEQTGKSLWEIMESYGK